MPLDPSRSELQPRLGARKSQCHALGREPNRTEGLLCCRGRKSRFRVLRRTFSTHFRDGRTFFFLSSSCLHFTVRGGRFNTRFLLYSALPTKNGARMETRKQKKSVSGRDKEGARRRGSRRERHTGPCASVATDRLGVAVPERTRQTEGRRT